MNPRQSAALALFNVLVFRLPCQWDSEYREERRAAAGHGLESCLVRVWAVLCCAGNVTGKMHFRCTYNLANKFTMANRKLKRAARKSISSWTAAEGQHQGAGSSSSCSSSAAADVESGNNNNNNTY